MTYLLRMCRGCPRCTLELFLTLHQHINCVENATDDEQGRLVGLGAYLVVGVVQFAKIEQADFLEPVYSDFLVDNGRQQI